LTLLLRNVDLTIRILPRCFRATPILRRFPVYTRVDDASAAAPPGTSSIGIFDPLLAHLVRSASRRSDRGDGVAFFRAAMSLYGLEEMVYLCINMPVLTVRNAWAHCLYSNSRVTHCVSEKRLHPTIIEESGLGAEIWKEVQELPQSQPNQRGMTFPLQQRTGELAVVGIRTRIEPDKWTSQRELLVREVRILANYFHGHTLRMNGFNSDQDLLVSARELDCLKWTAAGKTAWEASVILGITERTVRFHLNAAREKLKCATTTQAVAKAVAQQLIDLQP
jgi:DNA-binding CsgD family transcriptional regulator